MKKIILFLLLLGNIFGVTYAQKLEVKANIPSGTYNFPIEINLLVNDKDAKIFYYTDGEGRMDHIKDFTKPILLKENTQLDFYGTTKNYEDTLIQTNYYTFEYSDKIILTEKNGKLILKNNSGDIQNIGYWTIESENLDYTIPKNTYIDDKKTYTLDYILKNNEKVSLFSPDNSIKQTFVYKTPPLIPPQLRGMSSESETGGVKEEKTSIKTQNIPKEEIKSAIQEEPIIKNTQTGELTQTSSVVGGDSETGTEKIDILQNSKSSILETKKEPTTTEKSKNLLYILLFLAVFMLYNIGLFLKKNGTFEQMKTKINKIGKK